MKKITPRKVPCCLCDTKRDWFRMLKFCDHVFCDQECVDFYAKAEGKAFETGKWDVEWTELRLAFSRQGEV